MKNFILVALNTPVSAYSMKGNIFIVCGWMHNAHDIWTTVQQFLWVSPVVGSGRMPQTKNELLAVPEWLLSKVLRGCSTSVKIDVAKAAKRQRLCVSHPWDLA